MPTIYMNKGSSTVKQKCSSHLLYFQLGFEATRLVSSDNWRHEPDVSHRRYLLTPKCTGCGLLTQYTCPRGIFVAASAYHGPSNELDVYCRPPFSGVWDTAHPLLRLPAPSATILAQVTACSLLRLLASLTELKTTKTEAPRWAGVSGDVTP